MELGARLRQARLEMGLSQRQLCGDVITRNMLSQIENGSAKPSMETLCCLAGRLEKPVSFFLEEEVPVPHNQQLILQAREAEATEALRILEGYEAPDPVFDPERWLLEALTCLKLAQQAVAEGKNAYARDLLEQAKATGEKTPYFTEDLERRRLLLCYEAGMPVQAQQLPAMEPELLLRAQSALEQKKPELAGKLLDAATRKSSQWHFLRGSAWEMLGDYEKAAQAYLQAEPCNSVFGRLEQCYKALGDYKNAYEYACRQR